MIIHARGYSRTRTTRPRNEGSIKIPFDMDATTIYYQLNIPQDALERAHEEAIIEHRRREDQAKLRADRSTSHTQTPSL